MESHLPTLRVLHSNIGEQCTVHLQAILLLIMVPPTTDNNKEVALAAFNGTCNRCGKRSPQKLNVIPNNISMDKRWEPSRVPTIHSNRMTRNRMQKVRAKQDSKEHATTPLNMGTRRLIVERRKLTKRKEMVNKKRVLQL